MPRWEVHRHCLLPESAAPINIALRTGSMRLIASTFLGAERDDEGWISAHLRSRVTRIGKTLIADRITDCWGSATTRPQTPPR